MVISVGRRLGQDHNHSRSGKGGSELKPITFKSDGDLESEQDGAGVILRSPDGTKTKRIRIDNNGNIVSEEVE